MRRREVEAEVGETREGEEEKGKGGGEEDEGRVSS